MGLFKFTSFIQILDEKIATCGLFLVEAREKFINMAFISFGFNIFLTTGAYQYTCQLYELSHLPPKDQESDR